MALVFRTPRPAPTHFAKATGEKAKTLKKLESFLEAEEPKTVRWLVGFWGDQQEAVTYKELREAVLNGDISQEQLETWQNGYAELINGKLAPQWEKAMEAAAAELRAQYPDSLYEPSTGAARAYIAQHGAELVTNLAAEQKEAIRAMVAHTARHGAMTADSLSRMIRPVIGLTAPQAVANLNYCNAAKDALMKANPKMAEATAEKKAREKAAKYAARQHRYRAMNIARTELASAYSQGAHGAAMDAQAQGYMGEMEKVWLTADDERVCALCGPLDGERRAMGAPFSNGVILPPAHPSCRCAVAYEEAEGALTQPTEGGIMEPQGPAITEPPEPEPAATTEPLPQAGTPVTLGPPEAGSPDGGRMFPPSLAGVPGGEPMSHEKADTGNPNPNYGQGGGYKENCQSCVVTYEARLRGYDVRTLPATGNQTMDNLAHWPSMAWIDPATGKHPERIVDYAVTTPKKVAAFIEKTVEPGCRYTIAWHWKGSGRTGHIISLDRDDAGALRFYDPQSGITRNLAQFKTWAVKDMRLKMKIPHVKGTFATPPEMLRVDDKLFDLDVARHIMEGAK